MYLVILHEKSENGREYHSNWPESFSSMKAAVRFGMRAYRKWEEVIDFRVKKIPKRNSYAETLR